MQIKFNFIILTSKKIFPKFVAPNSTLSWWKLTDGYKKYVQMPNDYNETPVFAFKEGDKYGKSFSLNFNLSKLAIILGTLLKL